MATQLKNVAVGTSVKIKRADTQPSLDAIVVHQGKPSAMYDDSFNNGTIIMIKYGATSVWHNATWQTVPYSSSTLNTFLSTSFISIINPSIINKMKTVKIPYRNSTDSASTVVSSGASGFSCKIFAPSLIEMGVPQSYEPTRILLDGAPFSYFLPVNSGADSKRSYVDGRNSWTRSNVVNMVDFVWYMHNTGAPVLFDNMYDKQNTPNTFAYPIIVLPNDMYRDDITGEITEAVPPAAPTNVIVTPNPIVRGNRCTISWDIVANATYYYVGTSINGGPWSEGYVQVANPYLNRTIPYSDVDTVRIQYRVCSMDANLLLSDWTPSPLVDVIKFIYPPTDLVAPINSYVAQDIIISWTASLTTESIVLTYKLERSINNGTFTQINDAKVLTFTDKPLESWNDVRYRVKTVATDGEESEYLISDAINIINSLDPPTNIVTPTSVMQGDNINIMWSASSSSTPPDINYALERSFNDGEFEEIAFISALTFTEIAQGAWSAVKYRVKAVNNYVESSYTVSNDVIVFANMPPVISGEDEDVGEVANSLRYDYTVTDENGGIIMVIESIDEIVLREYMVTLGVENTAVVDGNNFFMLGQGEHVLTITATDNDGNSSERKITFTKIADSIFITLKQPLASTTQPKRVYMYMKYEIPAGATFKVEVTNNPFDATPIWEDCTSMVKSNLAYVFNNKINVSSEHGLNIRVNINRNNAIGECWVAGIDGNFE